MGTALETRHMQMSCIHDTYTVRYADKKIVLRMCFKDVLL